MAREAGQHFGQRQVSSLPRMPDMLIADGRNLQAWTLSTWPFFPRPNPLRLFGFPNALLRQCSGIRPLRRLLK